MLYSNFPYLGFKISSLSYGGRIEELSSTPNAPFNNRFRGMAHACYFNFTPTLKPICKKNTIWGFGDCVDTLGPWSFLFKQHSYCPRYSVAYYICPSFYAKWLLLLRYCRFMRIMLNSLRSRGSRHVMRSHIITLYKTLGILQLPAVRQVTWYIPWSGPGSFASKSISVYQTWIAIIHLDITLSDLLSSYSTAKMGTKM